MSGRLTIWGAQQLLTVYFSQYATPPLDFYLALIKDVAPTPFLDGTELDEPLATDYARILVPNDQLNWANDSEPQVVYNTQPLAFTVATSDWGLMNFWALCDSPTDGNLVLVGDLEQPLQILTGDQAAFDEGDLTIVLGPFYQPDDPS